MASHLDEQSYSLVDFFEDDDFSETETFHEYTKLTRRNVVHISRRVEEIKGDRALLAMMSRSWKTYPGSAIVEFPPFKAPSVEFAEVVFHRRSISSLGRDFADAPVDMAQLGILLRMAYGPTARMQMPGGVQHLRATTSAGALYPTELYVAAFKVDGLAAGLYHYRPIEHQLETIRLGEGERARFSALSSYEQMCRTSSAAIVMTSLLRRTLAKYQHRGYRFAMYDCGAVVQSLYLAGTAAGLDTCALGGIYDDEVSAYLETNPVDEPVQLGFLIGPRTSGPTHLVEP
ncbi:MAG: hypothetical protein BGO26_20035 [Actinobacteria bacterium 69-20]|nr:SagB/ThcOx family dehydrogenase [Actinomycetota bacterium]OJV24807.1 MAG: hypothetical protein BGO26_20035 [Actinobacteria bacterium 69-20]